MRVVDAVLRQQHAVRCRGKAPNVQCRGCRGRRHIGIVIVPQQHGRFARCTRGQGVDVRMIAHAGCQQRVQRYRTIARRVHPIAAHQGGHAEEIEHRLVDAVGGERAKALEVILVLEFERPAEHGAQIDAAAVPQFEQPLVGRSRIGRVERAVAIVVGGIDLARAGRAALGIGLAQDDRQPAQGRVSRDDLESPVGIAQFLGDSHGDATLIDLRPALGVERDEIERHVPPGRRASSRSHVAQEIVQESVGRLIVRSGARRAADPGRGQCGAHAGDRVVVQFPIILGARVPVRDVGLVPYLKVPLPHVLPPVTLHQVRRDDADQLAPFGIVLGRIVGCPGDRALRVAYLVGLVPIRKFRRQILRHEAQLHQRPHAGLLIGIEDAVQNREIVDRSAVRVLAVDVGRTPFQIRHAVTRGQQMVDADGDRHWAEVMQFAQQRAAVGERAVVRLVVPEPGVQRFIGPDLFAKIHLDGHGHGRCRRRRRRP